MMMVALFVLSVAGSDAKDAPAVEGRIVAGASALVTLVGVAGAAASTMPALRYLDRLPRLDALREDFRNAANDNERKIIAREAAVLREELNNDLRFWNDVGVYLAPASLAVACLGVGGVAWGMSLNDE
jgi:hypothetical protein